MTTPPPDATWTLACKHLGRQVHVFNRVDSTNTLALSLSHDPSHHGLTFLAREQTAGRGQHGRTWQAPAGSSVLLSVLLFPPPALRRPALLTAWAAVSVCETIRTLANLQALIKWPNDVLIEGKKVCGILIEQRTTGRVDFPVATVAGIGLNVSQTAAMFTQAGLPLATSLHAETGAAFDFKAVAKELIRQLDEHYNLLGRGDSNTLEALWKSRLGLLGKRIVAEGMDQEHRGRLRDATFAAMEIDMEDGSSLRLLPESIRHLRPLGD